MSNNNFSGVIPILSTPFNENGLISFDDLKKVSCEYVDPIILDFEKHALVELPPNGQGVTAFLIKKMLEISLIRKFVTKQQL